MQTEGVIYIGEAARWAAPATARLSGYPWNVFGGAFGGGLSVGLGLLAAAFAMDFGAPQWLFVPVVIIVTGPAALIAIAIVRVMLARHFRRKLIERDVVNPLPWRMQIQNEALVITTGEMVETALWSAVSEIFPIGPYWVLLAQGSPTFIAKRNFSKADDERAFVGAVLEKLTEASRTRSKEAVRFAEMTA